MKVKNIRLEIKSEEECIGEAKSVMKKLSKGLKVKPKSVISFESLNVMRKFITDRRLKILKAIKKHRPSSIYELAKILNRDTKNVSNDVKYLEEVGLVELERTKEGRAKTIPSVDYDKIILEISV